MLSLRRLLLPLALTAAVLGPAPAQADPAPTQADPASLPVKLILRGDPLPAPIVAERLGRELGVAVSMDDAAPTVSGGVVTVTLHAAARELIISYSSPKGPTITRSIPARDRMEDIVEDAVLLAGNLARDESNDIVGPEPVPALVPPPAPVPVPVPSAVETAPPPEERLPASASFFFPLATDVDRRSRTSSFDFNLLYGRIGGIDGAQLGLVNVVATEHGRGVGGMKGFELGVLANFVERQSTGVQVAGLLNRTGSAEGLQLALLANMSAGDLSGAQVAATNIASGDVDGFQAGAVNIAGDLEGVQLGVVNIGKKIRGVTVGAVNVADDVDGVPIGVVSVTKSGGVHPVVWSGTSGFANAGVRFSTRYTYTSFYGSYHHDFHRDFAGGGFLIGGRIPIGFGFHADIDLAGTYLVAPEQTVTDSAGNSVHEQLVQPRLRLSGGYRPVRHFGVFLGVAVVGQFHAKNGWDEVVAAIGPELFGGVEL